MHDECKIPNVGRTRGAWPVHYPAVIWDNFWPYMYIATTYIYVVAKSRPTTGRVFCTHARPRRMSFTFFVGARRM